MAILVWGSVDLNKLKELAARGLSAGEMAIAMRRSRNTIIGKCWRNDIKIGERQGIPHPWAKRIANKAGDNLPLADAQLRNCRWINGDPRNMMCCGKKTFSGYYCPEHRKRVYQPMRKEPI